MINEKAVAELLEIQSYNTATSSWLPWITAANSVTIQRGGKRVGIGATVDTGTLTATLINTGDPLNSGALKPNDLVRAVTRGVGEPFIAVPAATVYTQGFEGGTVDGWTQTVGTPTVVSSPSGTIHAGTKALVVAGDPDEGSADGIARRTLTGLTVGRPHTFTAWANANRASTIRIGVTGLSFTETSIALNTWVQVSYTFTPTATSHALFMLNQTGPFNNTSWDDITVVRNAYAMANADPSYRPAEAIFTGRIYDINTSYALDKNSGKKTTRVTFAAADAVRDHANTTRYGAVTDGGVGYETWAQRVIRLSTSAAVNTTVNPPADDAPIVRYSI